MISSTFSLIVILIIRPVLSGLRFFKDSSEVCDTDQCRAVSTMFTDNMNPRAKPCKDFYEYVCGKFANTTVPDGQPSLFYAEYINRSVQNKLIGYLSKPRNKRESDRIKWAKGQFQACMNTRRLDEVGIKPLLDKVNECGEWSIYTKFTINPPKGWLEVHDTYNRLMGKGGLFTIGVVNNPIHQRNVIGVHITQDVFLHMPGYRKVSVTDNDITKYTEFLIDMSEYFRNLCCNDSVSTAHKKAIEQVIIFRTALAKIRKTTNPDTELSTLCTNIDRLQNRTMRIMYKKSIDWLGLLKSTFEPVKHVKITISTSICIKHLNHFLDTIKIIDNTPQQVIIDHLHFYFLENYMEYSNTKMYQLYQRIHMELPSTRSIQCISNSVLMRTCKFIYVRRFLPKHTISLAEEIFQDVRHTLSDQIHRTRWMSKIAKQIAMDNLNNRYRLFDYRDWYSKENNVVDYYTRLPISRDYLENTFNFDHLSYFKQLSMLSKNQDRRISISSSIMEHINHHSHTEDNKIMELPVVIHDVPFFGIELPDAINYASLGTVHGELLSNIFYDSNNSHSGRPHHSWDLASWQEYMHRQQFYSKKIDNVISKNFVATQVNHTINPKLHVDQAIIEYMALLAAFEAYQKRALSHGAGWQKLIHLKHIGGNKLFFVAYAITRCEAVDMQQSAAMQKESGERMYLPYRLRVNIALSNMRAFSDTFHCKINDPMSSPLKVEFLETLKTNIPAH